MLIKIAMGQMLVDPGQPQANLQRASRMIAQAAELGCTLVLLPECLDIGWTHPAARDLAQPIPGANCDVLCRAAREHRLFIATGLVERDGDKIHNAAVLISPGGEILVKHRKINELDFARDLYIPGRSLSVVDTPLGAVGLAICADLLPESVAIGHALALMGARIILSPCAWAVPADHDNSKDPYGAVWCKSYSEIATAHHIPVIGVSNVGPITAGEWAGRNCIGCSLAISSSGKVLAQGPYGRDAQALAVVELS